MTQEEKQLLLKDLCARLPYGVNAQGVLEEEADYNIPVNHEETVIGHVDGIDHLGFDDGEIYVVIEGIPCELSDVKLYLRPMSSMTEEERKKYHELCNSYSDIYFDSIDSIDWLNAHHFDYHRLIEKGLAIKVTEENNPYKN